ncbi:MAG: SUF system Fe-S cluster assembly regulator [Gammaproteobacteria bacterium RIFCSPHIGHO2_12_FULL_37_14]|nr:MAG: SUF system Fe-S cluster assembly regulator [Gammaproteobacteria bacterium RIFCSPHIGHO2_12_FULL_37_14]
MLRISKLADYAMLVMTNMAKRPEAVLSASLLAEALHLTVPTVSKVLKMLSEADLVASVRGPEGGYHLARPAQQVTVADVVMAIEGKLSMTECCQMQGLCNIESMCTMKENWLKINKIIYSMLSQLTIMDMSEPLLLSRLAYGK